MAFQHYDLRNLATQQLLIIQPPEIDQFKASKTSSSFNRVGYLTGVRPDKHYMMHRQPVLFSIRCHGIQTPGTMRRFALFRILHAG